MDRAALDQTRQAYSEVAASYVERVGDTSFEPALDLAMVGHFLAGVGVGRDAEVLDAGCGAGRMLTYLEQLDSSLDLTGADLAPGMVDQARARHPSRRIVEADLAALPFEAEQFDGVLSWYSIVHTPTPDVAPIAAELGRVLRPGGSVLLGFHAGSGVRVARQIYGHDIDLRVQLHQVDQVAETLAAAGFEVVARLERAAGAVEKNAQGFVLAARV